MDEDILRMATECAQRRRLSMCDMLCDVCVLDITKYGIPPRQLMAYRHSAKLATWPIKVPQGRYSPELNTTGKIFAVFVCVFFFFCVVMFIPKANMSRKIEKVAKKEYEGYTVTEMPTATIQPTSRFDVMKYVQENIYDVATWSGAKPNEVNCVDYAVLTYIIGTAKTKEKYRIIRNINPNTGMNHLFVYIGGLPYEPQNGESMRDAWGEVYDSRYDADVTETFRVIVGGDKLYM